MSQPQNPSTPAFGKEVATLAGGCFWCLEAVFDDLRGVESVESGYAGGRIPNPMNDIRYYNIKTMQAIALK